MKLFNNKLKKEIEDFSVKINECLVTDDALEDIDYLQMLLVKETSLEGIKEYRDFIEERIKVYQKLLDISDKKKSFLLADMPDDETIMDIFRDELKNYDEIKIYHEDKTVCLSNISEDKYYEFDIETRKFIFQHLYQKWQD